MMLSSVTNAGKGGVIAQLQAFKNILKYEESYSIQANISAPTMHGYPLSLEIASAMSFITCNQGFTIYYKMKYKWLCQKSLLPM